jgi:hypothetical protein
MPQLPKPKPLSLELDPDGDNAIEQLVASVRRIESGLADIRSAFDELVEVLTDEVQTNAAVVDLARDTIVVSAAAVAEAKGTRES